MSLQITQWLWRNRVLVIKVSFSLTSVLVTGLMQFGEWCKGASRNSTRIFGRTIGKQTTFLWHTEFSQWPTSACLSEGRHAVSMSIRTEEESQFRQIQFLTYDRLRNKINSNNLFCKLQYYTLNELSVDICVYSSNCWHEITWVSNTDCPVGSQKYIIKIKPNPETDWGNYTLSARDDTYFLGYLDSYTYKYTGI